MLSESNLLKAEQLYLKYSQHMYKAAYKVLHDHVLAEDALHNAIMKVMKNLDKIDETNEPKTISYLCIIAQNEAKRVYNAHHKVVLMDDPEYGVDMVTSYFDTENLVISRETLKEVKDFVKDEKPVYRDTFVLRYFKDHTIKEVADITNSKEDTVYKRLQRLVVKIENNLGKRVSQ